MSLKYKKDGGLPGIEFSLFARVLLLGRRALGGRRPQPGFSAADFLQHIPHLNLNRLLQLLALGHNALAFNK